MTEQETLREVASKINPRIFLRYLKGTGWRVLAAHRSDIRILQRDGTAGLEQITLPFDAKLNDYAEAMLRAAQTVAYTAVQPLREVLLSLLNPSADVLKIRVEHEGTTPGNIFLDDAIAAYDSAKRLLTSTAMDVVSPTLVKYHRGRPDKSTADFLANCQFGQTEIGSYVITVVCPFMEVNDSGIQQLSLFSEEEQCAASLTRRVTKRIMDNLTIIKESIDEDNTAFLSNEAKICANFYEALMGLNLQKPGGLLEITASWSPLVKENESVSQRVTLTRDYAPPIENAIATLKAKTGETMVIVGRIKKLSSAPDVKKRKDGNATVVYIGENNRSKSINVLMSTMDYENALEAHKRGLYVEIIGHSTDGKPLICEGLNVLDPMV